MWNQCWVKLGVQRCNPRFGRKQPLKRTAASHIQVPSIQRCWHYLPVGVRAWVGHQVPMVQLGEQCRPSVKIRDVSRFNPTICLTVSATELRGVVSQPQCLSEVRARGTRLYPHIPRSCCRHNCVPASRLFSVSQRWRRAMRCSFLLRPRCRLQVTGGKRGTKLHGDG